MNYVYSLADPFTRERAQAFEGKFATVVCRDDGLTASYQGIIAPLTNGTTKVGDEVLFNECIFRVVIKDATNVPR